MCTYVYADGIPVGHSAAKSIISAGALQRLRYRYKVTKVPNVRICATWCVLLLSIHKSLSFLVCPSQQILIL